MMNESIVSPTNLNNDERTMEIIQLIRNLKLFTNKENIIINESLFQYPSDFTIVSYLQGFTRTGGNVAKKIATSLLVGALTLGMYVKIPVISSFYMHIAIVDNFTKKVIYDFGYDVSANPKSQINIADSVGVILVTYFEE